MNTRLAVFGGVYSNHLALREVIAEIGRRDVDHAWCLGDLGGFGPHPDRSVALLRESGTPTLRGNYDDSIGHDRADCGCGYTDPLDNAFAQRAYDYTASRTAAEHKRWMREQPEQQRLTLAGRRVLFCHGSPRRANEFLWDSTCSDAFLEWLCDTAGADLVVCGHTGLPWDRPLPSGRRVVNVGAIGRPANDGHPGIRYAEITIGDSVRVEFRPIEYDFAALAREMEDERLPAEFVATIRSGWWTTCLENLPAKERMRGRF